MAEPKKANYLTGAAILAATVALTKVVGFVYKIPLFNILGDAGAGHFNVMYYIYNLLLTISTAGVPVALSRLISEARASSRPLQARRYYSVALVTFGFVGLAGSGLMFLFAPELASFMKDPQVVLGVRLLSPAVFFACILSVLRGYAQGHNDMRPTAVSQILEVMCKLVFGLAIAWYLKSMGYPVYVIAAGAIVGVVIGLGISVPVLAVMRRRVAAASPATLNLDKPASRLETAKEILKVTIPITLSSSVLNVINLVDTSLVRGRLASGAGFSAEQVDILYGVYSKGVTLFSLPSSFVTPIAVAVVPVIAAALVSRQGAEARSTMESSMKLTNLFAMPAAVGLAVLSGPIFDVLFPGSNENGPMLLSMLGIASYFVCTYLITNGILQATGHEKLALLALPVGGVLKICVNYILVGDPAVNIAGAPIGTLCCYGLITLLNIIFLTVKLPERPNYLKITLRPLLCALLMGAAAWGTQRVGAAYIIPFLGGGRMASAVCLFLSILAGLVVYFLLIVLLRAVTKEDILLLPKGEKIANMLKIRK